MADEYTIPDQPSGPAPRIIAVCSTMPGPEEITLVLNRAGGSTVVLSDPLAIAQKFDLYTGMMQGLFISGDEEVDPDYYEYADEHAYDTVDRRIKQDPSNLLIRYALEHRIPILATGHGALELNEILGGRINPDANVGLFSTIRHAAFEDLQGHRHQIFLQSDSPLRAWLGVDSLRVNSQHHQAIKTLAPGLRPMAHAADGIIEAFYQPEGAFVVGLQFLPSLVLDEVPELEEIFRQFIRACSK